jgi:hypothetical protein
LRESSALLPACAPKYEELTRRWRLAIGPFRAVDLLFDAVEVR